MVCLLYLGVFLTAAEPPSLNVSTSFYNWELDLSINSNLDSITRSHWSTLEKSCLRSFSSVLIFLNSMAINSLRVSNEVFSITSWLSIFFKKPAHWTVIKIIHLPGFRHTIFTLHFLNVFQLIHTTATNNFIVTPSHIFLNCFCQD